MRAQRSANGNGSDQINLGDKPTNTIVNRNIHKTDENEPQTPKNDGPNRIFPPVNKNIDATITNAIRKRNAFKKRREFENIGNEIDIFERNENTIFRNRNEKP